MAAQLDPIEHPAPSDDPTGLIARAAATAANRDEPEPSPELDELAGEMHSGDADG